jgi:hypothetical protein
MTDVYYHSHKLVVGKCRKDGLQNLNRLEREIVQGGWKELERVGRSWLEEGSVSRTWLVKVKGLGWPKK